MEKNLNSLFIFLLLLISSCSMNKSSNESSDYVESENSYKKNIKQYSFTLKPLNPLKLYELNYGSENKISDSSRDSILHEYQNYLCFVFEIDIDGFKGNLADYEDGTTKNSFEERSNYYLFGMQNDFFMKSSNGSENPCAIYYYERLNELAHTNRFIVGFRNPGSDELTLEYNNPLFNCGKVNFSINKQHLALN